MTLTIFYCGKRSMVGEPPMKQEEEDEEYKALAENYKVRACPLMPLSR